MLLISMIFYSRFLSVTCKRLGLLLFTYCLLLMVRKTICNVIQIVSCVCVVCKWRTVSLFVLNTAKMLQENQISKHWKWMSYKMTLPIHGLSQGFFFAKLFLNFNIFLTQVFISRCKWVNYNFRIFNIKQYFNKTLTLF